MADKNWKMPVRGMWVGKPDPYSEHSSRNYYDPTPKYSKHATKTRKANLRGRRRRG